MRVTWRTLAACAAAFFLPAAAAAQRSAGDLLVVANKNAATATVIDVAGGRALATLPTGQGPHEVAASADGRWAVVADYGDQAPGSSLTVIDLDSLKVARTIPLVMYRRPHGIAFLPGNRVVAVTVEANRAVLLVDVAAGEVVAEVPTGAGGSHMLALSPDGKRAYTANVESGSVSALDLEGRRLLRAAPVAPEVEGIAITPDGRHLWVGSNRDQTVTVLDAETLAPVDTFSTPSRPYRVTISPDGRRAVVPSLFTSSVHVFDVGTRTETRSVAIPEGRGVSLQGRGAVPMGSVVSPDGKTAYVALQARDQVAVIDLERGAVVRYLDTGSGPDGIALSVAPRRR